MNVALKTLLNFFKRKQANNQVETEEEMLERLDWQQRSDYFYEKHLNKLKGMDLRNIVLDNFVPRQLTSVELSFLKYINRLQAEAPNPNIAGYWTHEYNIKYQDVLTQFFGQELIVLCIEDTGKQCYTLTDKGQEAIKPILPSATKNLELEDSCYIMILNGRINKAYITIAEYEAQKPLQRGLNVNWKKEAKCGLSPSMSRYYEQFLDKDLTTPRDLSPYILPLKACIILGDMLGISPDKTAKMFNRICETDFSQSTITDLIYNITAIISNENRLQRYKTLDIAEYRISGTLDISTCNKCAELDGKVFNVSDAQTGVNYPPFHSGCRCSTVPHFEGNIKSRYMRDTVKGKSIFIGEDISY